MPVPNDRAPRRSDEPARQVGVGGEVPVPMPAAILGSGSENRFDVWFPISHAASATLATPVDRGVAAPDVSTTGDVVDAEEWVEGQPVTDRASCFEATIALDP